MSLRTYRCIDHDFGANQIAMLHYAMDNPGCEIEEWMPNTGAVAKRYIRVTKEQSLKSENNWLVRYLVKRCDGDRVTYIDDVEVSKEDWG